MRKIFSIKHLFLFYCILFLFNTLTKQALAQITIEQDPKSIYTDSKFITITLRSQEDLFDVNGKYSIGYWFPNQYPYKDKPFRDHSDVKVVDPKTLTRTVVIRGFGLYPSVGEWTYKIWSGKELNQASEIYTGTFFMYPSEVVGQSGGPISLQMDASQFQEYANTMLNVIDIDPNTSYTIWFARDKDPLLYGTFSQNSISQFLNPKDNKFYTMATIPINVGKLSQEKQLCIEKGLQQIYDRYIKKGRSCKLPLKDISVTALLVVRTPTPITNVEPGTLPTEYAGSPTLTPSLPQCAKWADLQGKEISKQEAAGRKDIKCIAVDTAIGDISTDPFDFVKSILSVVLSLAGGIAVVLIIISGYRLMTSQGNPEAVQGARDQLTSAIVGFLFIIFSLVILQVIGVDILRIPGFGG